MRLRFLSAPTASLARFASFPLHPSLTPSLSPSSSFFCSLRQHFDFFSHDGGIISSLLF